MNAQLHSCKVFWRRRLRELPGDIQNLPRFEAAKHVKELYTAQDVASRVDEAVRLAVQNGSCALRLFADVDDASGLRALGGLLDVKERYADVLPIQIVAFPQDGVFGGRTETLMREALERGADVVGGIPWIEADADAQRAHTDMCFSLAAEFDKDLHLVCDDTIDPTSRTLGYVAQQTVAHSYQGRVAATQCAALAFYDDDEARSVIAQVKAADITVFSNSHVSLVTTPHDREPYPRGITRVRELLEAEVPVACAQDDVDNWYYPFGRNDLLEVAQFMAHTAGLAWGDDLLKVLPMVTSVPAKVMGLGPSSLTPGSRADIVVLDAPDWHQAIQFQADKRFVIIGGRLRATTERHVDLML